MSVPYEGATTGNKARDEITKILRRFGCEAVGFHDDFSEHRVTLVFSHRGRRVNLRASAKGWAAMWLKEHPWGQSRSRVPRQVHEQRALNQGLIAVNSILRDWIKGQVTAVECGILEFDAVFLPFMLTADGRPAIDALRDTKLLPAPTDG